MHDLPETSWFCRSAVTRFLLVSFWRTGSNSDQGNSGWDEILLPRSSTRCPSFSHPQVTPISPALFFSRVFAMWVSPAGSPAPGVTPQDQSLATATSCSFKLSLKIHRSGLKLITQGELTAGAVFLHLRARFKTALRALTPLSALFHLTNYFAGEVKNLTAALGT